jgi:hypothetical protein
MVSSGMLQRVALVRNDVSEEPGTSFIRVTRISELGTTQAATTTVSCEEIPSGRLLVTASVVPSSPILVNHDEGGPRFLRNVGSYKSYTA